MMILVKSVKNQICLFVLVIDWSDRSVKLSCTLSSLPWSVNIVKYIKVYKCMSYKISRNRIRKYKMCCINFHLIVDPFTFNKYCIHACTLFYMILHNTINKTLYNKVFFGTIFTDLLMFSCIYIDPVSKA